MDRPENDILPSEKTESRPRLSDGEPRKKSKSVSVKTRTENIVPSQEKKREKERISEAFTAPFRTLTCFFLLERQRIPRSLSSWL